MTRNPTNAERRPWKLDAACLNVDPETMYDPDQVRAAKKVCRGCPVRESCLRFALDTEEPWGVWGGFDDLERRRLLAGRPAILCARCRIEFVPRVEQAKRCPDCVEGVSKPSIEDVKDEIIRLAGDHWSDPAIARHLGYTFQQIRYARRKWGVAPGRPKAGRPHQHRLPGVEVKPCGTDAAYRRHLRLGEPVDEACRQAEVRRGAAQREKQRAKRLAEKAAVNA